MRSLLRLDLLVLVLLLVYPFVPFASAAGAELGFTLRQLVTILVFATLALALNLEVGEAGLLQLGIAAFFALGAFTTGILTVEKYPFQVGFYGALVAAPLIAGVAGFALGAPTVRLRGDYLAIVTLGFGEVVRVTLLNLESITDGPRGLNPIPDPWLPGEAVAALGGAGRAREIVLYYVALAIVTGLVVILRALDGSRPGRALAALREDELASACTGVSPARTKLAAFAAGGAIAGLAGAIYATNLTTTADPNNYDFATSIFVLCCVIVGGLGSVPGAVLGAFVIKGFDDVVSQQITKLVRAGTEGSGSQSFLLEFSSWRWLVFGLALVLVMRFRPEGLLPSARLREELHPEREEAARPGAPGAKP